MDYAGSIGARDTVREQFALYHYPKAKTVAAARAAGIDVVDGVTLQFRDLQQCEHDARSAAQMGFDGKWAIHPDQLPVINRVFTPSPEEISRAREIIDLYENPTSTLAWARLFIKTRWSMPPACPSSARNWLSPEKQDCCKVHSRSRATDSCLPPPIPACSRNLKVPSPNCAATFLIRTGANSIAARLS